jgi:hypothetical protein
VQLVGLAVVGRDVVGDVVPRAATKDVALLLSALAWATHAVFADDDPAGG